MSKWLLTWGQHEILLLLSTGGSIRYYLSPGATRGGGYFLEKKGDHRDFDGRIVGSLIKRGWVQDDGGALVISKTGRAVL